MDMPPASRCHRRAADSVTATCSLRPAQLPLAARTIAAAQEGILFTDADRRIEFVNPAFCRVTGYTPEEVIGHTPALLASGRHDAAFYRAMWASLTDGGYWEGEIWNRRKNGQLYLERMAIAALTDDQGRVTHYAGVCSDITRRRENEQRLRHPVNYDPLTGLPSRRLLEDRLVQAIRHAHRQRRHLAVVFVDLDHFKQVNDSLGHAVGDELLILVAERLGHCLREDDTLARLGGDAFLVLLPELGELDEATRIARRLIESVAAPFRVARHEFRIGCSLGISVYPGDGTTAEALVHNADVAMGRAKHEGRNTYRLFRAEMNRRDHDQLVLETALRNTVESGDGLEMYYQPLVDRDSGELEGAEALMRWRHPEVGEVSPAVFIALAERAGLIIALWEWSLHQVAARLQAWRAAGLTPPRISVNLSARQFWQQGLVAQITELFARYGLPPGQIGFELTESVLLDRQQEAAAILQGLRELGCRIAIDDFGTGYSSLSYLQDLPLTTLKIDRCFVQRLTGEASERRGSAAIIAAVTGLAQELSLRVVAEGVETAEQLAALSRYPVTLIQGYLTGRPVDAAAFERDWLRREASSPRPG